MAKIEDVWGTDGDWGGIEQATPTLRIGYGNNWVYMEKTLPNGDVGVYNIPHVPQEKMADFLAWLANLT
jgi:hypothetical protein